METRPCHAGLTSYINACSVMGQSVKLMTYTKIPRFKYRFGYWTTFSPALQALLVSVLSVTHSPHFYAERGR
jgi:hypothetical protein